MPVSSEYITPALCPTEDVIADRSLATCVTRSPCFAVYVTMLCVTSDVTPTSYFVTDVVMLPCSAEDVVPPPCLAEDIAMLPCSPEDVTLPQLPGLAAL